MKNIIMKHLLTVALISALCAGGVLAGVPDKGGVSSNPNDQNSLTWTSPGHNSLDSVPLGNGRIGLNAWVEEGGDLVFLVSSPDTRDGDHTLRKLGRVRMALSPNPFAKDLPFKQTLDITDGALLIKAGKGSQSTQMRVWVDANHPVVHIRGTSESPLSVRASLEMWRDQKLAKDLKDDALEEVLLADESNRLLWYHRNKHSSWEPRLQAQGMWDQLKDTKLPDPLLNLTFGAVMQGNNLVRGGVASLKSQQPSKQIDLALVFQCEQAATLPQWIGHLNALVDQVVKLDPQAAFKAHSAWWHAFWNRSWISIHTPELSKDLVQDPEFVKDAGFAISQRYVLQRFINACSNRGDLPVPYNGNIFNTDVPAGVHLKYWTGGVPEGNPDWRAWGDHFMWQNTRHSYWPMPASGDFDLMLPVFKLVRGALEVSKARARTIYNSDGGFMTEEMLTGGPCPQWPTHNHLKFHFTSSVELPSMMLDYYRYTQDSAFAREYLIPAAETFVTFYDKHYPRDASEKLFLSPAGVLECYSRSPKACDNPMPEIAGLRYLLGGLVELPASVITDAQRANWKRFLVELPEIPTRQVKGQTLLAPAGRFDPGLILEYPELYGVFPFRQVMTGKPGLEMARQSFAVRRISFDGSQKGEDYDTGGWISSPAQAPYLNLARESARLVLINFQDGKDIFSGKDLGRKMKFPAFWGAHYNWIPDQDHGGNSVNALQNMLIQADGKKIYLLPAWPEDWNVTFKLHAPSQTTVECVYCDGKVQSLKVTPAARAADVMDMSSLPNRVRTLVRIAGGDRNYLFDLSPMSDGVVTQEDVNRLKTTGPWLAKYGESLFGVRGGPFAPADWGTSTCKDNMMYLHLLKSSRQPLRLPPLGRKIVTANVMHGGSCKVEQSANGIVINVAEKDTQTPDTIVALKLDGPAWEISPAPLTADFQTLTHQIINR